MFIKYFGFCRFYNYPNRSNIALVKSAIVFYSAVLAALVLAIVLPQTLKLGTIKTINKSNLTLTGSCSAIGGITHLIEPS
tara:strand:- start:154 stop:393 length:240 start_codon:yes stop_codon:yes gene_type:complete